MIKRLLDSRLPLIVYNPPKVFDLSYFKRIFQAGGLPVLDTEFFSPSQILEHLKALAASNILFGIRLFARNTEAAEAVRNINPANLDQVVLAYDDAADLNGWSAEGLPGKLLVETIDVDIIDALDPIAPHGLIVKGGEAPGRVSRYSALILMQWYLENTDFPVFVHGGVGWNTAAGMFAAGASGLVLDDQLYLADEAPLSDNFKALIEKIEENDSTVIGESLKTRFRFFSKLGTRIVRQLKERESYLADQADAEATLYQEIASAVVPLNDAACEPLQSLFYLGQDVVAARHFARESRALQDMIHGLFRHIGEMLGAVDDHDPLVPGSLLADEHGTRYPIVQGPMANISDSAAFAEKVFEAGGLPFFALASLPENLADTILKNGKETVPRFGAGLIGIETFNKTINAHMDLVKKYQAPFALFAGGAPSQVKELEAAGTRAYLHTPSLGMLENALEKGCTRVIFEGGEAGGHVGNLSSLVLWELGVEKLRLLPDETLAKMRVLFAGGIGTRRASHFISGMTAHLAARGAGIGIQVGTSYLFTREIVETGAIKKVYQDVICERNETILMGTTVGLTSRTVCTPFSRKMVANEHHRIQDGVALGERKRAFESENIGSLLIGAKAFCPDFDKMAEEPGEVCFLYYDDEEQFEKGNFMVGDCLAFDRSAVDIPAVHGRLFNEKAILKDTLNKLELFSSPDQQINDEIAIIGMGCIAPDAADIDSLWQNVLEKTYSIREVPDERFDSSLYYDADRKAEDKSYSKIAGMVTDFVFDHEKYGYTPEKAGRLSRSQQMILETAYQAMADTGYLDDLQIREDLRQRTAVVVATCLGNELSANLHLKYFYPELAYHLDQIEAFTSLDETSRQAVLDQLRQTLSMGSNYEPVHGSILNIEASRIAYHMGIEGANYVVDAACATSLAAVDCAVKELLSGTHDMVIAGGVNTNLAPETFVGFCKMGALSDLGSFPFDERASGFVLGEGAGAVVLKRLKDAKRDGDPILGVIRGIGSGSDGKGKAIAAPSAKGQTVTLNRCYEAMKSGIQVEDIDFIEAHGTGTKMGDLVEADTLKRFYTRTAPVGVSSIKSQIGHLLGAAGMLGLIKAVLAIRNRTLPPNGAFEKLSSRLKLEDSSLFVIQEAAPWEKADGRPRAAAVSSYGFGGINYHVVVSDWLPDEKLLARNVFSDPAWDFNDNRIVFAGVGVVLPGARDADTFFETMETGRPTLAPMPEDRFHNAYYAAEVEQSCFRIPPVKAGVVEDFSINNAKYKIPPMAARYIDRAQQFGLEAADQAISQANLTPQLTYGNRVAVIMGTITGTRFVENIFRTRIPYLRRVISGIEGVDSTALDSLGDQLADRLRERYLKNTEDSVPGLLSNIVSARISKHFGCNGANFVVDASCASSTMALDLAVKGLRSGDYEYVIAGGVDANLYPGVMLAFKRLGLLAEKEPRFFDHHSDGYVMGEGAATMVMTTYRRARENNMPILGEFKGMSVASSVPAHLLSPSDKVYQKVIDDCYDRIPVRKQDVEHLDVFGVSNAFLDAVEKAAIERSFTTPLHFGNIKAEFGYFKAANPAVVLARLLLMASRREILPHRTFDQSTTLVESSSVLRPSLQPVTIPGDRSLNLASNVNGIGGNHGHLVVGTLPRHLDPDAAQAGDTAAAEAALPASPWPLAGDRPRLVALLSGQGAQYAGMMKPLYDAQPTVREILDRGEAIFKDLRGYSLLSIMFEGGAELNLTQNTQPAVFITTAALYSVLKDRGLAPDFFIGHSVGEYSALYCAGILDFDAAMRLIIRRADFMKAAIDERPGKIMVVFQDADTVAGQIRESGLGDVWVANKNSESQTAVSGTESGIEAFCKFLADRQVTHRKLALSGAFHTPLFDSASRQMADELAGVSFRPADFARVISNVTAAPYPGDAEAIKGLLSRQIVSPVEFIRSIQSVYAAGGRRFIEIGPGRLLSNLLKKISIGDHEAVPAVDPKKGEAESFAALVDYLEGRDLIAPVRPAASAPAAPPAVRPAPASTAAPAVVASTPASPAPADDADYRAFLEEKRDELESVLYEEYRKFKREQTLRSMERFNFYPEKVMIAGVSVGLPGSGRRVFDPENFDRILEGVNCIEPLSQAEKERMVDMNITRVFKQPDGNARFVDIVNTRDVIQLAGKLGYFEPTSDYGFQRQYDVAISLSMAAGIEALKDAKIPLVMNYKTASTGSAIPDRFTLPEEMQDTTGVIMTSLFPGFDTLIDQLNKYYYHKFYVRPYKELENIYYHLMMHLTDDEMKEKITDWFFKIKERRKKFGNFKFDRNLLFDIVPLGSAHFAQLIKARGPNIQLSGACASATQAAGVAEDWIRSGRCDRVIIIGGEASTSESQMPWVGSGFLAMGAATIKSVVSEAAKPFDARRNGTILGSGAVSMIVERADRIRERGLNGQAEILGTYIGNSAFHGTRIDVGHLTREMTRFIDRVEHQHGLVKDNYVPSMVFMSHETFTPARGGSASAEVAALKAAYPANYRDITITNTKGYTGHTLGAAIEDAVLVKAMQKGMVPPVANLKEIPEEFRDLKFNTNGGGDYRYGLHFSAGFGSHFAFLFLRRVEEADTAVNPAYENWLKRICKSEQPHLTVMKNTLCVLPKDGAAPATRPAAPEPPARPRVDEPAPQPATAAPAPVLTSAPAADVLSTIQRIVADQTGYPVDMLEPDLDLEADLGIDTVKQVEMFGKIAGEFGLEVPEDLKLADLNTLTRLAGFIGERIGGSAEPVKPAAVDAPPAAGPNSADVLVQVQAIIAEQTGYTVDMLEPDLDLEADLGIDTVKQVEIFGKVAGNFGLEVPEDLKLADLNTIAKLADYIAERVEVPAAPETVSEIPSESAADAAADVLVKVQAIIAEQTGYTVDMLEPDLDLEADLGIDTVKQVEIFGKVAGSFGLAVPEDLKLADLNTITLLAGYIADQTASAAAPAPEESAAAASDGPSADDILPTIQAIIAEQTGYTVDMLEPDLDLEADLGIDTVKQVEIFGKIAARFNLEVPEDLKLAELNTIGKLAADLARQMAGSTPEAEVQPAAASPATDDATGSEAAVHRFVTSISETPVPSRGPNRFEGKTILVSADRHGFAGAIAERITAAGGRVITIGEGPDVDISLDLADIDAVEKTSKTLLADQPDVSGFIHLRPLEDCFDNRPERAATVAASVKSFFLLTRELYPALNRAGSLVASLALDSVVFPYDDAAGTIYPAFAGIAGAIKTVAKEMPEARVKMVDISDPDPKASIDRIADLFIGELLAEDNRVEAGYRDGRRFVPALTIAAPEAGESIVRRGDTVLVTGGARGITYEILKSLVDTYRTNLVIFGRSPIDAIDPAFLPENAGVLDETAIFARLKDRMTGSRPVEIRRAAGKLVKNLESLANIEHLRSMGVEVEYHAVDVTDPAAVAAAAGRVPTIDGVIHAAGVEESQWIDKKEMASFNRVFDTKVAGALNLIDALADRPYRFMIGFSSVTARFGNEGQVDYTAANDMLCKILQREARLYPDRAYKVFDWTAWAGAGMATRETVKKVLAERGIEFLPLEQGIRFFMDELSDRTSVEVLVSGLDTAFDRDGLFGKTAGAAPERIASFLDSAVERMDSRAVYSRVLDLKRDLFLLDHSRNEVPIFLGATGIETMAEAAATLAEPGTRLAELCDFSIPYGIKILKGRPKELMIEAERTGEADGAVDCRILSRFRNKQGAVMGEPRLHYQGRYRFTDRAAETKRVEIPEFRPVNCDGNIQDLLYHPSRLFMDGLFRTVEDILSFEDSLLISKVRNSSDREFFAGETRPSFLTDVAIVDAMFQTGGMLEVMTTNVIVLPYTIGRMTFHRQVERDREYYCLTRRTGAGEKTHTYDLSLVDPDGNLYLSIERFEMVKVDKLAPEERILDRIQRPSYQLAS